MARPKPLDTLPAVAQELYDLVFEEAPSRTSPASSRVHRDTRNRTMLGRERVYGALMTSARLAFTPPQAVSKPEHGRKPLIKEQFFRKAGLPQMYPAAT
jgi:hypothetical protein